MRREVSGESLAYLGLERLNGRFGRDCREYVGDAERPSQAIDGTRPGHVVTQLDNQPPVDPSHVRLTQSRERLANIVGQTLLETASVAPLQRDLVVVNDDVRRVEVR
jgi:hypothetical protein